VEQLYKTLEEAQNSDSVCRASVALLGYIFSDEVYAFYIDATGECRFILGETPSHLRDALEYHDDYDGKLYWVQESHIIIKIPIQSDYFYFIVSIAHLPVWSETELSLAIMLIKSHLERTQHRRYLDTFEVSLEMLIESIPDPVFLKDGSGCWRLINSAGKRLFQLQGDEWYGKTDDELALLKPDSAESFLECRMSDAQAWHAEHTIRVEEVIPVPSDATYVFDVHKTPLFKEGKRQGLIIIGRDITDSYHLKERLEEKSKALSTLNNNLEKRIEEELLLRRERDRLLEQKSRDASLGNLLLNIAHHWRQPLSALSLIIQDLPDAYDHGEINRVYLESAVNRTMKLVSDMSETIDRFRVIVTDQEISSRFDAKKAISDVIDLYYKVTDDLKIMLAVSGLEGQSVWIEGNRGRFRQMILALLDNAKDAVATLPESRRFVDFAIDIQESELIIDVSDHGYGMDEHILKHIFDPYFTTKRNPNAKGLGMYDVKRIVEDELEGVIRITSDLYGTQCRLRVPIKHF